MTTTTRLEQYVRSPQPVLPESQIKYLQEELRKIENSLGGAYGALTANGPYAKFPHGMFMSDQDQANAGTTSENLVTYNQPVWSDRIRVESNSQLKFDHPGKYLVTFSLQFTNRGNSAAEIEVWAKRGTENYPLSNTRFDIAAKKSSSIWAHQVAAVSGIFDVQNVATDYLQIAWWSDGADVFLENYAAGTSPTRPEIPSVILTANFVSGL